MPAQHLPLNTGMIIARYSHGRRPNTQQGSKAQAKIKTLTRHGWRRRGSRLIKSGDKPLRHRSAMAACLSMGKSFSMSSMVFDEVSSGFSML